MQNTKHNVIGALAISALILALSGCEKEPGPAERAGQAIDNSIEKAGAQIEKAGEKIQDAAKEDKK